MNWFLKKAGIKYLYLWTVCDHYYYFYFILIDNCRRKKLWIQLETNNKNLDPILWEAKQEKKKMKYRPAFSAVRLAFLIVTFAFVWSLFLFFSPKFTNDVQIKESDRLKSQIVKLSKQYISSLAKEKGANEKGIYF